MSILKKSTWVGLGNKFINWNWALVVCLIILGIVFSISTKIAIYYHEKEVFNGLHPQPSSLYNLWLPFLEKLGYILLSAGFFATFLKSFQFIGVFKEEIKKVISEEDVLTKNGFVTEFKSAVKSDEILIHSVNELHNVIFSEESLNYATREQKEKIWKNATYSLYDPSFPDIDEELVNKLLKFYVPQRLDYIQTKFIVEYEIKKKDDNHITIIENLSYDVVPGDETTTFKKSYYVWKEKTTSDLGNVEIQSFLLDGIEHKQEFEKSIIDKKTYDVIKRRIEKNISKKKISVKSTVEITHSTRISPHWRYEFGKFTKGLQIRVKNQSPRQLNVHIELTDERLDLQDILLTSPELYQDTDELLLPTDGYILIINPRNEKE